jgi:branched-chain amino acid transport system permease protein
MTDFLQLAIQGIALGAIYALIALGFVIVYKATAVINFAQGELVLLGAYLVYAFNQTGLPFAASVALAVLVMAGVGWAIERTVLRRMVGKPAFAVVMITIGLAIVIRQVVAAVWGFDDRLLGEPWATSRLQLGDVGVNVTSIVTIGAAGALLLLFFVFFRLTRAGIGMRATALDQEAALAVGIPVQRVFAQAWMIAGATAAIAGVFLVAFPATLQPAVGFTALRAFPAAIVGGLDSPGGAVLGGILVGLVEVLVQGYQPQVAPWLGNNLHVAAAYLLMIVVLMVRPYGLFGTRQVERV